MVFIQEIIYLKIYQYITNKNIITNIYRIQAYDSIIYGYFCIKFIDFMLKSLLEHTNLFSPSEFKKNDKMILKYLQENLNKKNGENML